MAGWTTIKVPTEIRDKVKELSEKLKMPQWRVLLELLNHYTVILQKPKKKKELPEIDKAAWYIVKLAMSVGAFKENTTEQNKQRLLDTISQVGDRLDVDISLLVKAVNDYMRHKGTARETDARMELNEALKITVIEIISKEILNEE